MYVLNQGSTENDMISDVFLLYLLDRKRGAAKDYLKEAKTEGVMDPLQDGDLSSLHSQLLNLGYFGHNEKEFKSEEKTKLVISMNSPSSPPFYPLIIIFQVISS